MEGGTIQHPPTASAQLDGEKDAAKESRTNDMETDRNAEEEQDGSLASVTEEDSLSGA